MLASLLLNKALLPSYTLLPLDIIQSIAPWDSLDLGPLANPLISDPFYSFYPRRFLLTQAVRTGQLPLWNPGIMTGTPSVANPNFQPFYPPNLLTALVLPAQHALPWLAWFHLTATGALMYLFLRRHHLHRLACALGGGIWLLNGYTLVWLENPHRLSTVAWLPGILWAYEAAAQDRRPGLAALGGLFLGLAILGGQMQFVFGMGLMFGLYGLAKIGLTARKEGARPVVYLAVIGLIGLGIGALTVLPSSEFAAISQRVRLDADSVSRSRWPLTHLVTLIAPNYYGNPVTTVPYWGPANYAERTAYFGLVGLFLALSAPFLQPRKPFFWYALVTALGALTIVLGAPLTRLIFLIPGSEFVILVRLLFLVPFAGTLLAAAGLDAWLEPGTTGRRRLAASALAVVAIITIALSTNAALGETFTTRRESILRALGSSAIILILITSMLLLIPRRPRWVGRAILAIAFLDLLAWGITFNPIVSTEYLYPRNEVTDWLQQDPSLFRVLPLQSERVVFGPNVLTVYGQQEIGGYTPLIQRRYRQLFKSIDDEVDIKWMAPNRNMLVMSNFDPLVSLLNVKYVLSARDLPFDIIPQARHAGCTSPMALGSQPLTATLAVDDPGLNRIDLSFVQSEEAVEGTLDFWVWRDQVGGELVAHITRDASSVANADQSFFFAPVADSAGKTFVWGVSGPANLALCSDDQGRPQFAAYATWLQERGVMQGVHVYENPNVLPRAYVVHHVLQKPEDQVLDTLHSPDFDWYRSAIIESALAAGQQAQMAQAPEAGRRPATVTAYQAHEVTIDVADGNAGLLVLSDAHYPGWSATLDDQPVPVQRVNGIFRGVFVPAGSHQVRFRFRPTTLTAMLILAGAGLSLAAALLGLDLARRRP